MNGWPFLGVRAWVKCMDGGSVGGERDLEALGLALALALVNRIQWPAQ